MPTRDKRRASKKKRAAMKKTAIRKKRAADRSGATSRHAGAPRPKPRIDEAREVLGAHPMEERHSGAGKSLTARPSAGLHVPIPALIERLTMEVDEGRTLLASDDLLEMATETAMSEYGKQSVSLGGLADALRLAAEERGDEVPLADLAEVIEDALDLMDAEEAFANEDQEKGRPVEDVLQELGL
jgi:hypothetical protein